MAHIVVPQTQVTTTPVDIPLGEPHNLSSHQTCEACMAAIITLSTPLEKHTTSESNLLALREVIGSIRDIRQRQSCQLCQLINQAIQDLCPPYARERIRNEEDIIGVCPDGHEGRMLVYSSKSIIAQIMYVRAPLLESQYLLPDLDSLKELGSIPLCSCCSNPLRLCRIQSQINLGTVQRWLRVCESDHTCGIQDKNHETDEQSYPSILVDVRSRNLAIQKNRIQRYCSLSYVYGNSNPFRTTRENLSTLQQPGALSDSEIALPATIRDAMTIVEGIGEKYLWVDSLCIVHDDEDLLQDAIRRMGDYYQNSILTIAVVSTLAACEQIPGIAPESRKILPYVEVCGMQIFAFPVPLHLELKGSKYESRAWTYQERLLSTRTLYITNNMAYYKCLQHGRSELDGFTVLAGHLNPLQISTSIPEIQHDGLDTPQKPSQWEIYLELVRQYSQKELSYPSDELAAFEGIMRRLSSTWNTKFLAGLPISALLTTLHWVPSCKLDVAHETSERRAGFPSWSWASRAGPVEWLDAVVLPEWWEWEEKGILSPVMSNPVATFNFTAQIHLRSQVSSIKGLSAELTTTIVYAAQFLSPGRGNLMPLIKIFDTQGRWCGRICHSSPGVISNQNTDELGIIMLSTCAARKILTFENAETMEYRGWEYFFDHGVFPTTGEDGKPARLCNLLLVEYKEDGMAERRALCQIHSDIWEIMERKEQDVILI